MEIFVRSPYNYDADAVSRETALVCDDESKTKQSFVEECDINTIVRRFNITGQLPSDVSAPTYADYDDVFDFHSAMSAVAKAHEAFEAMPAEIRSRFHNDPGAFVEFCSNQANREEAVKLGLVFAKELATSDNGVKPEIVTPPGSSEG